MAVVSSVDFTALASGAIAMPDTDTRAKEYIRQALNLDFYDNQNKIWAESFGTARPPTLDAVIRAMAIANEIAVTAGVTIFTQLREKFISKPNAMKSALEKASQELAFQMQIVKMTHSVEGLELHIQAHGVLSQISRDMAGSSVSSIQTALNPRAGTLEAVTKIKATPKPRKPRKKKGE